MQTWTSNRFDELKAGDRLPTPPGVALALLRLTASESSTAQEIAKVLEGDPALVGRAIKLANSVAAGGSKPVASAREAVVRLGLHAVSNLALGFWLVSQSRTQTCKGFDYTRYWQQSLAVAAAAKAVAVQVKSFPPDEAFTCGLLSLVGRLVLATIYPEAYAEIIARCELDGVELLAQLERERFATDHSEMTVAMMEDWGLPPEYPEAVFYQSVDAGHLPERSHTGILARVLDLGFFVSRAWMAAETERPKLWLECMARGEKLGISPTLLLALGDRAMEEWRQWAQVLKVPTPDIPSFAELAERPRAAPQVIPAIVDQPRAEGLRVLVVSQDADVLQSLADQLAAAGHVSSCARSREEALQKVLSDFPQALVLDGFSAGGEGDSLCRHLRQARLGQYLYVVALTASQGHEELSAVFDAGVDDFLVKPVHASVLTARLRAGLRVIGLQEQGQRDKEEMRRFAMELAVANRRLQHAAYEDSLTRLPNRRCALERLTQESARAARTGRNLACIVADLDHFKRVNDTYGHDAGDQVLQAIAELMRSTIRSSDLACRLGGEEFVILCPDADVNGARLCAERLCARVAAHRIRSGKAEIAVTISMGVAAREIAMKQANDLLKKADKAVYAAKQSGRNRVCV